MEGCSAAVRPHRVADFVALIRNTQVHIDHALIESGVYDTVAAEPIMRGGGPADYFGVSDSVAPLHSQVGFRE